MLYDMAADPHETRNLAGDPAHAETLARMRGQVEDWQNQTRDPWLYKDGVSWLSNHHHEDHGLPLPECHDTWLPGD